MPRCWLSLGSNVEPERNLLGAVRDLRAAFGDLVLSPAYRSEAVGFQGDPFLNLVAGIETTLGVGAVADRLRAIEAAHGRTRDGNKFGARTLDIDLLTHGGLVGRVDGILLPRDEILKYAFVLRPLVDVGAEERHPEDGRTYAELWAEFDDTGQTLTPVDLVWD